MTRPRSRRLRVFAALCCAFVLGGSAVGCGSEADPTDVAGGGGVDVRASEDGAAPAGPDAVVGADGPGDAPAPADRQADETAPLQDATGDGGPDDAAADTPEPEDADEPEDAGPCPLGTEDPRCDDGDPCTLDGCYTSLGGCGHAPLTGTPCEGGDGCGVGVCEAGECVGFSGCDDGYLCTLDRCEAGGVCRWEEANVQSRQAVDFELVDTNPYSATYGETFSLARLEGKVVVLVFMASGCEPCCLQGEAARPLVEELSEFPEVFIAAVDTRSVLLGGSPESIETCVTTDSDQEPPLRSQWPYLRDNDEWQVWNRYCAENYRTVVVDAERPITYYRNVNFEDPPFRAELKSAIEAALGED